MTKHRPRNELRFGLPIAISLVILALAGCGSGETPDRSTSPGPVSRVTDSAPKASVSPPHAEERKKDVGTRPADSKGPGGSLRIFPEAFKILSDAPGLQLQAVKAAPDGAIRDLTRDVRWRVEPADSAAVDASGYLSLRAAAGREIKVEATAERETAYTQVAVEKTGEANWDFAEEIVPIFTKQGCNTGSCHGKAEGRNGFRLSLFGYDPEGDYRAMTREAAGRRVSVFRPEESLLLSKASGKLPHGGGIRLGTDSASYLRIRDWIRSGAPMMSGTHSGRTISIRLDPPTIRLSEPGSAQVRVMAQSAGGRERDVTRLSLFRSLDDTVAHVTDSGWLKLLKRTETDVIVRFGPRVTSLRVSTAINPDLTPDFTKFDRRNLIDEGLFKRLAELKVPASPRASDAAFLRRVSLDLTGQQPNPQVIREFLADPAPDKRAKLVDRLLASPEFVLFWRIKLGDLLQISRTRHGDSAFRYLAWIDQAFRKNLPWDETVRTLLTALGDPNDIETGGPVNYAVDSFDPKVQAEQTAQRFLGIRLRCAQCHDHPFDVWTQDDYYGLAAFFARVGPRGNANGMMSNRRVVSINPTGQVLHLRTGQPSIPKLLDGKTLEIPPGEDPRKTLAAWMVAPENPYFARAMANWTWAQLFGRGLVDPPDDMSRANPPVHPTVLDALANHFKGRRFDLKDLIRTIATSETYGLSSATVPGNEADTRLFSHHIPRPLSAHQMADALAQATDVPNRYDVADQAARRKDIRRSIDLVDPLSPSLILDTFGRCDRNVVCVSVPNTALSLRQALLLIGGDVIESKVTNLNGYLANALKLELEPEELVENLYFRTVCRPPTPEELSRWTAELKQAPALNEAAEDLFWSLLNSREFAFNH